MKTERIIFVVFLFLFAVGCVSNKTNKIDELKPIVNNKKTINIELLNNKTDYKLEPIKLSEFVDSVKFIIIEETKESLIKDINNVFFTQEYIIAVDNALHTIFFFDWNGKYVRKISRRGQGPGEYLSISSSMFDEQKQELIIYDISSKSVLFYDMYGNFARKISEFSENTVIRDIINLPNGHFLCYRYDGVGGSADKKYIGLWEVDGNGKFVRNLFTYHVNFPVVYGTSAHLRQISKETISLRDHIHDDIYHINYQNGIVEKFISYNKKGNKLSQLIGADVEMLRKNQNIRSYIVQEKGNYVITYWFDEESPPKLLFSLFSKNTNKVRYWDAFYSYDTTISGVLHIPVNSNRPDILVCGLNRIIIDDYLSDKNLPELVRDSLMSLSTKLGNSENPVLELLYIKK